MAKRALITGITGQDGSYLAELLLSKGYEVIGLIRRSSTLTIERISHIQDQITLVSGDLVDEVSLINVLRDYRPSEVYNLAAQSFVQTSWTQPVLTGEITALGVTTVSYTHLDVYKRQASNGEEAIDLVEVTSPDVVLMDIRMPVMDGIEAVSYTHLHQVDPRSNLVGFRVHQLLLTNRQCWIAVSLPSE